ncbi:GNAT family N-acetyltransferase [Natronobeatus ordinarius]|uniref:GNAT family N-acetyltransferase n=1 Tax=Natronobeatus ordinarius TaxID=2963433 RepID=UPI0020CEA144|nr:GNAT family N-acetyltransferase [Natronobeatus ordinarius]
MTSELEFDGIDGCIVRKATAEDAPAIRELWDGYAAVLADYDERFEVDAEGRERWQGYFTNSLVESSRGDVLLAERDGRVVGALEVRVIGGHPVFKFGQHGYVYGHYVHPDHRGEGIGTALLEAAEAWFRERELPFWRYDVLHGEPEEAFYEGYGMRPMETVYEKEL